MFNREAELFASRFFSTSIIVSEIVNIKKDMQIAGNVSKEILSIATQKIKKKGDRGAYI